MSGEIDKKTTLLEFYLSLPLPRSKDTLVLLNQFFAVFVLNRQYDVCLRLTTATIYDLTEQQINFPPPFSETIILSCR